VSLTAAAASAGNPPESMSALPRSAAAPHASHPRPRRTLASFVALALCACAPSVREDDGALNPRVECLDRTTSRTWGSAEHPLLAKLANLEHPRTGEFVAVGDDPDSAWFAKQTVTLAVVPGDVVTLHEVERSTPPPNGKAWKGMCLDFVEARTSVEITIGSSVFTAPEVAIRVGDGRPGTILSIDIAGEDHDLFIQNSESQSPDIRLEFTARVDAISEVAEDVTALGSYDDGALRELARASLSQ
jgi:hypothetical protein